MERGQATEWKAPVLITTLTIHTKQCLIREYCTASIIKAQLTSVRAIGFWDNYTRLTIQLNLGHKLFKHLAGYGGDRRQKDCQDFSTLWWRWLGMDQHQRSHNGVMWGESKGDWSIKEERVHRGAGFCFSLVSTTSYGIYCIESISLFVGPQVFLLTIRI